MSETGNSSPFKEQKMILVEVFFSGRMCQKQNEFYKKKKNKSAIFSFEILYELTLMKFCNQILAAQLIFCLFGNWVP